MSVAAEIHVVNVDTPPIQVNLRIDVHRNDVADLSAFLPDLGVRGSLATHEPTPKQHVVRIRFTYRPRRNGEITFYLLWLRQFEGKLVVDEVTEQHGVVFLVIHVGPDEVKNESFEVWMVHVGESMAVAIPAHTVRSLLHEPPTYVEVVCPG